jgi:tetratricopeptide (TPR) repeat protein
MIGSQAEERRWRLVQGCALLGLTLAGVLALRPVRGPESDPQPLLQRTALLRQAVEREPENPVLLLRLARTEFAAVQLGALRDYNRRFPDGAGESLEEQRERYESWLRGYYHAAPGARRALALARRAAAQAPAGELRSEALLTAGSVCWQRGEERRALGCFRAACRAWPASLPAWRRVAAAAGSLGEMRLRALALRRLDQLQPDPDPQPSGPF